MLEILSFVSTSFEFLNGLQAASSLNEGPSSLLIAAKVLHLWCVPPHGVKTKRNPGKIGGVDAR